jgi:glycosyltransferase involved in cell wall biosynthesis
MRVLFVSNVYPPATRGGYELLCAGIAEGFGEFHEVRVLTSGSSKDTPNDPNIVRELTYLGGGSADSLRAPLAALRAAKAIRRLLAEWKPDVVFVWNGADMPQAAIRIAEQSGTPIAYSLCEYWFSHIYETDRFMRHLRPGETGVRGLWARALRLLNRHPALRLDLDTPARVSITYVSEAFRDRIHMPPTALPLDERVIFSCVNDPDLWKSIERRPATEPPTIAFAGRLERQKGPQVAYRAIAALRDRHGIDVKLVLAGRAVPGMEDELARLAAELRIEDRVELLGMVDQQRLGELFGSASALVLPAVWAEPSGTTALEGGLARVPVVASRSGGMPEGLLEEEHALYFEIGDHDGCADALARVLNDPADTEKRCARAYERAQLFTFDRYTAQMNEFIETAVRVHRENPVGSTV